MLIALNKDKKHVCAFDVEKYDSKGNIIKYYCPECGEELILRKGSVYQHHFSHKNKHANCSLHDGGESDIHNFMKYKIKKIMEEDNDLIESEIEYPVGSRIADYYCTLKHKNKIKHVAVEIVHKHENIKDFIDKCEDYYDENVYCIWIFNISKFTSKSSEKNINNNDIDKIISSSSDFLDYVHVTEIMKNAHLFHYGMIYALDAINEIIYSIHLESLSSINPNKTFVYQPIDSFNISFFSKCGHDKFLEYNRCVAGPFIDKYWNKKPYDFLFKKNDYNNILDEDLTQSRFRKEFYSKNSIRLGKFNLYEIVYYSDDKFINENYIIFKNIRGDYYYKCVLSNKINVLDFIKTFRIRINAKNIKKLFSKVNDIMILHGGGSFITDSNINKVVNKKDLSEYDDLIYCFSKNQNPLDINEEFMSLDEYLNYDKSKIKDLRIISEHDKYKLIELIGDKKFLHGEFDSWEEADDIGRKL